MRKIIINQVELDEEFRIHVRPQLTPDENYQYIDRAAMSVRWDVSRRSLYAIAPDLDPLASYKQIARALKDEYGHELVLSDDTVWNSIPATLKDAIQNESFSNPTN